MAKKEDTLVLYSKLETLLFYAKNLLIKYPKSEKFDLCSDIKQSCYKMLALVMYAIKEKDNNQRLKFLKTCDVELSIQRTLVRLSYKMKYITDKNFMTWGNLLEEIGKILRRLDKKMPRKLNNFYLDKIKFRNMYEAYERAAKAKHENKEVVLFEMNLARNLFELCLDLYNGTYRVGQYRKFFVYEPKKREILALPFRDRVMQQWYVEEFIKPIFVPKMITDSHACIKGRGLHKAVGNLQRYMRNMYKVNPEFYIIKCDISKFFNNIDKHILIKIIEHRIKDKNFLKCTKTLIFDGSKRNGIPIGNYTSQFFANIYLTEMDVFIKQTLKINYYIRYMDDFILLVNSKEEAKETLRRIRLFLKDRLKLELNKKTNYFKAKQGVNFLGYHIFVQKMKLLNNNKKKMYKRVRKWNSLYDKNQLDIMKAAESFKSWIGHAGIRK